MMCKVLVKEVKQVFEARSGEKDGNPWWIQEFLCLVMVDGSDQSAERRVKTFDHEIAQSLVACTFDREKPFEADKQGDAKPYSFLLKPEKKAAVRRGGSAVKNNRQVALECAARVVAGAGFVSDMSEVSIGEFTILEAEKLLAWLEG